MTDIRICPPTRTDALRDAETAAAEAVRHLNAMDPTDPTAVSVLAEIVTDLAGAVGALAGVLLKDVAPPERVTGEAGE